MDEEMKTNTDTKEEENVIKIPKITLSSRSVPGMMRRCPITGGMCSHYNRIVRKKAARHSKKRVMIFMIMHYSPITDTIYEWLFKDMLKKQKLKFRFVDDTGEDADTEFSEINTEDEENYFKMEDGAEVCLIRADDYSGNSHIVCESVCARMQEADMIIADISYGNPNVFYELGMAVALGKQILPICYMHRYYEYIEGKNSLDIRTFPWKEFLFKFFSMNRLEDDDNVKQYQPDDAEFGKYPYTDDIKPGVQTGVLLKELMNTSLRSMDNLMLYDLSGFRFVDNRERMIRSCVDAYTKIVDKVREKMDCPGDRICLMYSDRRLEVEDRYLADRIVKYSFGDICRLAVNQVIHDIEEGGRNRDSASHYERRAKNYIYNSTVKMKLDFPVYVEYIKEHRFEGLEVLYGENKENEKNKKDEENKKDEKNKDFTFFDIMLVNAANCDIAFVDFRENILQALFWLGVFHGSGRFAVPLRYEESRKADTEKPQPVDVAGLWNAYYFSENSEEFRRRIWVVLKNIYEKKEKMKYVEKRAMFSAAVGITEENPKVYAEYMNIFDKNKDGYESFYRKKFWQAMLKDGDADIYPSAFDENNKLHISNWEYDGFSFIMDYIGSLDSVHTVKFQNVIECKRKYDADEEKGAASVKEMLHGNCIAMGDRKGNRVTASLLHDYEKLLFRLKRCERCQKEESRREEIQKEEVQKNDCLGRKCPLPKPETARAGRGFYDENKVYMAPFYTEEELKKNQGELGPMNIFAHFVIIRESTFQVILEGASGPGTLGLAKLLAGAQKNNSENARLFLTMQRLLMQDYIRELRMRLGKSETHRDDFGSLIFYISTELCNYFLPLITKRELDIIEKRAAVFCRNEIRDKEQLNIIIKRVGEWVAWIGRVRCLEILVEIEVSSMYHTDKKQDLRKLEKIELVKDSMTVVEGETVPEQRRRLPWIIYNNVEVSEEK